MRVTGSLVLYNNPPALFERAIACFLASKGEPTLVVLDNSPTPIRSAMFDHARVIHVASESNVGFGPGHNVAFARVKACPDVHLLLNPDVDFAPDVVPHLAELMAADAAIGLVVPQIRYPDGSLQGLCKLLPTPFDLFVRRFLPWQRARARHAARYELAELRQSGRSEVPSLSGCFMMVRSKIFEQVGGFDERFFMYMEDVDLVRRIGDHGTTMYEPSVSIVHHYAKGSYRDRVLLGHHLRSAVRYFNKWGWVIDQNRRARNDRILAQLNPP